MKLKKPVNSNYAAVVIEVKNVIELGNCDNVQAAIVMGNQVIVSKDVNIGDIGLYFPLECALSKEFLSANNLYRKKEFNSDKDKAGYFEENGRVRCVKFRGNKSEGLFMPIESVDFVFSDHEVDAYRFGDEFDELNGIPICSKYVPKNGKTVGSSNKQKSTKKPVESKIVDNQFRFHQDTSMLYKNLHNIAPDDIISVTYKEHGTSGISSKVLCKRKLSLFDRLLVKLGVSVSDKHYDYLYSSRKVIKNPELNPNAKHFYSEDIWGMAHNKVKDLLQDGMTLYYEVVGYLPTGAMIQKDYDYGCDKGTFDIKVYRITSTNSSGKVFEFSAKQVQDWCKENGVKSVEELYYGRAVDLVNLDSSLDGDFGDRFHSYIKEYFNEHDCHVCRNKVPEEGCVIRVEENSFRAYKAKSNRFYERETKALDKGVVDIETEN